MQDKLTKIFQGAKYEPPSDLSEKIWRAIITRDELTTKIKLWAFIIVGFISMVGLIPSLQILFSDFSQSGFYEYFSLLFSDGGSILSSWKEFIFSLAESLPIMSIVFTLSLVFIFFLSLKNLAKQIGRNSLVNFQTSSY